jgi:hypothetical protein
VPVYRVDALQDAGHSLHDVMGRLFRRRTGLARMTKANQSPIKATITVSGLG